MKRDSKKSGTETGISAGAILLSLLLLLPNLPASAAKNTAQLNKKYWPLQSAYQKALAGKNNDGIIEFGSKTYALFVGTEKPETKAAQFAKNNDVEIRILPPVLMNVARAYEAKKEYGKASLWYRLFLIFAKVYQNTLSAEAKTEYQFLLTEASHKTDALDIDFALYTKVPAESGDAPYFGAKFEPINGLYYGTAYNAKSTAGSKAVAGGKHSSGELVYVLFKQENVRSFDWIFQKAKREHSMIEVAWNLAGEGKQLGSVLSERKLLEDTADYLKKLKIPIILRFGAEMNIWQTPADPKEFIGAFRFVASIMRERAPNVAMLWSPNNVSAAGLTYEMFYPGDEYVDWVGISNYTTKYFLGNKNQTDNMQAIYLTGEYANPIEQIRPIVEAYGGRKPIMLSECGVENYSKTNREDLTVWAKTKMQTLYAYVPMVYPQVKGMFYFDFDFERETSGSRYALYANESVNKLYGELTAQDVFLAKGKTNTGETYKKIDRVRLPAAKVAVYAYAALPKEMGGTVTYKVDGKPWASGKEIPYAAVFDFRTLSDGTHTLTAELSDGAGVQKTKKITLQKSGASVTMTDGG